jgi:hypothetical protein
MFRGVAEEIRQLRTRERISEDTYRAMGIRTWRNASIYRSVNSTGPPILRVSDPAVMADSGLILSFLILLLSLAIIY